MTLNKRGSALLTQELVGGLSTFLASAYIIVVNPSILSQAGMPFNAVLTSTILVSFFSSLMMGLYARNPILIAPGMGLNAFFTFSVVLGMNVPWAIALGAVFWSGIVFLLLSIFNIRIYIVQAIPKPIRYAVAAGIGLFITLIGFMHGGLIVAHPATLIAASPLTPSLITFLVGLLFTTILVVKRIRGAIVMGILFTTLAAYPLGRWWGNMESIVTIHDIIALPDFSLILQLDLWNSLTLSMVPVIFAFVFTDMFDSLSTFVGLSEATGWLDEKGEPKNIKQSLITDAVATTLSGIVGSSPGTAYIESAVGIESGGRTGMTAVIAGLFFLPFLFLSPLLSAIPSLATAPALVVVGVFMVKPVVQIEWQRWDESIPCFMAMVLIPFSYSITQGIVWGFLSWTLLKCVTGKFKEVTTGLWVIDVLALIALALQYKP